MAWIRNQYFGNTETAVDMPPFLSMVQEVTSDTYPVYSWFYIPAGFPSLADDSIISNFILTAGTRTATDNGYTHIKFKRDINVSNMSTAEIRAQILHRGATSAKYQNFDFSVKYQGTTLATSNTIKFTSSGDEMKTFTCDLTGINKIDEIVLRTYTNGSDTSSSVTVRWMIRTTDGGYIKLY